MLFEVSSKRKKRTLFIVLLDCNANNGPRLPISGPIAREDVTIEIWGAWKDGRYLLFFFILKSVFLQSADP